MRQTINPQTQFGEVDISAITISAITFDFDAKSRNDILRLLRASSAESFAAHMDKP